MNIKGILNALLIGALFLSVGFNFYLATNVPEPIVKREIIERVTIIKEVLTLQPPGIASWYGIPEHGRQTYSGETYDMYGISAASPTLPMGTEIIVKNLKNGLSIRLIVNDKMPKMWLTKGRIIDLSYGAAEKIGMVRDGLVPIKLYVVENKI